MKHTKGPWKADTTRPGVTVYGDYDPKSDTDQMVATVTGGSKEEMVANGKLIALAPEMLEAIKLALETIKSDFDPKSRPDVQQTLQHLIARAEGTKG